MRGEYTYMFVKQTRTAKGTYLQIVESYRDKNVSRQKIIKKLGYLDDLKQEHDDPLAYYKALAAQMTHDKKEKSQKLAVEIDPAEELENDNEDLWNVGYVFLKRLYKDLALDKFWKNTVKGMNIQFDIDKIFQLLVFTRIMYPGSKRNYFLNKDKFFEDFGDFSLDDIYNAMDIYAQHEKDLQKWIYDHSVTMTHRDLSLGYFDCANYYFDIGRPDLDKLDDNGNVIEKRYRKRGPEKNHRPDPIVELGLLMDKTGIPLHYDLFPGNESEKINMLPIVNQARNSYGFGRIIIVADRGLNTSDNIYYLNGDNKADENERDGYIYGQSVRGADAEFKKWVLDQIGYIDTPIDNGSSDEAVPGKFRHKSRVYPKKMQVHEKRNDPKSKIIRITADQKQMVYYSAKYAAKQRSDRAAMVARAQDLIKHPRKYDMVSAKGASGYVKNLSYNKETGEVIDHNLELDNAKIAEEEKYDGYYSIVTSELSMSDIELRENYRGLIHIEDTFKVTKTNFKTRPIFHWTDRRIDVHFMICYTALVIIRLLEEKLNKEYTVGQIIESLQRYNCTSLDKSTYKFLYTNDLINKLGEAFEINTKLKYRTRLEIRRMAKY